jgi:hypothetical protein
MSGPFPVGISTVSLIEGEDQVPVGQSHANKSLNRVRDLYGKMRSVPRTFLHET